MCILQVTRMSQSGCFKHSATASSLSLDQTVESFLHQPFELIERNLCIDWSKDNAAFEIPQHRTFSNSAPATFTNFLHAPLFALFLCLHSICARKSAIAWRATTHFILSHRAVCALQRWRYRHCIGTHRRQQRARKTI